MEPTFATAGSSTLSLSRTEAAVGPSTGFAASALSGSRVDGRVSAAALPLPETTRVETPSDGKRVDSKLTPFVKSVSVSHAVVTGVPFVESRSPPSASSVVPGRGSCRQLVSRNVSKYDVSSCEQATARPGATSATSTTARMRALRGPMSQISASARMDLTPDVAEGS